MTQKRNGKNIKCTTVVSSFPTERPSRIQNQVFFIYSAVLDENVIYRRKVLNDLLMGATELLAY